MASFSLSTLRATPLSAPLKGALYMTAAAFCFAVMNYLVRIGAEALDPIQIAFFRNLFALLVMLPWLIRAGPTAFATSRFPAHAGRAVLGLLAMFCWFYSVTLLPLAEAVALNFTLPLFATAGAALILGEVVRARRWTATLIGFLGVLVILRPGFTEISPAFALPIVAAVFMAASSLMVKSLSGTDSPKAIVFYMNLLLTPLSLIPALFVWRWPGWQALGVMALLGLIAAIAHLFLTSSYSKADASAILPFDYTRLPFVAVIAYLAFGELPDLWTWVGAGIIAAATLYIARREARIARRAEAERRDSARAAAEAFRGR